MRKKYRLAAALLALSLSFAACSGSSNKEQSSSQGESSVASSEAGSSESAAKDEVIVATGYEASSLDPVAQNEVAATNAMIQIFEGLVEINEAGELLPKLAESWEVQDNQTFTFHLRSGVTFHNGEAFTSADVQYSLERAAKAAAVSTYFGDINLSSFETPDDRTIRFSLNKPNSAFLSYLAHSGAFIVNQKAVDEAGDRIGVQPVGTGPLKLESWTKNDRMVLTRFDEYWGTKPTYKTLVIRPITEKQNRAIELETGNVDIAYQLAPLDMERLESDPDVELIRQPINSTTYLGFNLRNEILAKKEVRQAISEALDVDTMVNSVFKGVGSPASGFMPTSIKYSIAGEKQNAPQNLEAAKQLLQDAGYANGFSIRIMTNENQDRIDMATIMKAELEKVGINVTIETLEWTTFLEQLKTSNYDMYILGWSMSINDPDVALYPLLHSSASAEGSNYTHFENEQFDALLEKGRLLPDGEERKKVYREAQELLYQEQPFLPLAETEYVYGTRANVTNFDPTPFAFNTLFNVSFK